ncbi:hypothetical protein Rhopal_000432-T1 [Rhodotorula paludigena]|uniref:mRNA guanylyltransferase n=1 Tax=Rhodotorula paludigena TaxID=86838 RepID=A0AAV5GAZ2_9BASI|nr:hypothetical protein Rhopal_000432-T1 [Rhodotorula paludigena]
MAESPNVNAYAYADQPDEVGYSAASPFYANNDDSGPVSPRVQAAADDNDDGLLRSPEPQPAPPEAASRPHSAYASPAPPASLPPRPAQPQGQPLPACPPPQQQHPTLPNGLQYNPALHPPKRDLPVPDRIPGEPVLDGEKHWNLRKHLADLCGTGGTASFWVCEKSDGVRVLVLIVATGFGQEVYLIDRKDAIHQCYWLTFPHQDGPEYNHSNTVLDGEFVIDVDPETGAHIPRLLVFDLLVLDSENVMARPLEKRYGRLAKYVVEPYQKYQKTLPPDVLANQPFEVIIKKQELSYGIEAVFRDHVPKLLHGNDGLIFTSAEAPYTPGTDPKILKWKPPSENSIDFVLQLKFPPSAANEREPDFYAKPVFLLLMNHGHEGSHYYDTMEVSDETWEQWKHSGEQYDDRVVEVVWDRARDTWKFVRFRDDKFEGNFKTVVASIIRSIEHGVEAEQLVAHAGRIRRAWKARAAARAAPPPPPRDARGPPVQGQQQYHANGHNGYAQAPPQQQQGRPPAPMGGYGGGGGGGLRR